MYFFCYYTVTMSIELTSSVELPCTGHLLFSEPDTKNTQDYSEKEQMLCEIFLPPLDVKNNQGTMVLVYWEPNSKPSSPEGSASSMQLGKTNTILELFVDGARAVHTTALLRSDKITSDKVCSYLSFSIRTVCRLQENTYVFVDNKADGRPYIKKMAILPKRQPVLREFGEDAVYTIVGVLVLHIDNYAPSYQDIENDAPAQCEAHVEFVIARAQHSGVLSHQCSANPKQKSSPLHISVHDLLLRELLRDSRILLTTSSGDLLLVSTRLEKSAQTVQCLVSSVLLDNGAPLMFSVQNEYTLELHPEFLRSARILSKTYSWYSTYIPPMFVGDDSERQPQRSGGRCGRRRGRARHVYRDAEQSAVHVKVGQLYPRIRRDT